ncbi:hypothetical protein RYZ26_05130 [Terasakiella sp. A23]|uniref:hypothetical protein n=1 Tax=Terasakiella sp. FCG-A23 TaxID=3080561 RepID=UPI0029537C30|nr:hypothetical protein [Terasakiella sp. A23]MDV7338963.1 hypothetical protein [Terasakiella sp. A23]
MFKWIKKAKKLFSSGETTESGLVHIDDDGFMSDDISVSIEDIVSQDDMDDLGKIHVLSLTEFHEALGEIWDKREAKIFLLTESVLRQRIGEGNRWEHQSKEIYIMLFPRLSEMDGAARAYDIAEELGLKIIGERFDGSKRPLIRVAGVDPKDALTEDGKLDIRKLEKAGREGESAGDAGVVPDETKAGTKILHDKDQADTISDDDIGPAWRERHWADDKETDPEDKWEKNQVTHDERDDNWQKNEHHSTEHDTDWQKNQHDKIASTRPNWKKMDQDKKEKEGDDDPQWVSMEAEKTGEEKPTPKKAPAKPTSPYSLSFAPCWDKTSQSLATYKALLNYEKPGAPKIEGARAYSGHKTAEQRFKIDIWVMQTTGKTLFPLINKKIRTPVFVPLHSSSLRGDMQEKFFEMLARFTHDLRKNYLILEIMDDGVWDMDELGTLVGRLKELVHGLAFTPSATGDFKAPACEGFDWIGIDLSALTEASGISPDRLIALQGEIDSLGAKSYMFGITQRAQLAEFLDLGAEMLSGKALVRTTAKLRPPFALPIERLKG